MQRKKEKCVFLCGLAVLFTVIPAGCQNPNAETGPKTWIVSFSAGGGTPAPENQTVTEGDKITEPAEMTKEDGKFNGWYRDETFTEKWDFAQDTVESDVTLYASWIPFEAGDKITRVINGVAVNFRFVPPGRFQYNAASADNVAAVTTAYWLSETEVTQELYQAVMGYNPSALQDNPAPGETQSKRPAENMTWYDVIDFCNKLSQANGREPVYTMTGKTPEEGSITGATVSADFTKNGYRLPTEMEWMWAAMGADTTEQPNTTGYLKGYAGSAEGAGQTNIGDYAWYTANSKITIEEAETTVTHEVGKKLPNELSLYDMSGNVDEWLWDWGNSTALSGTLTDYRGLESATNKGRRGGRFNMGGSATGNFKLSYRSFVSSPGTAYNTNGIRLLYPLR